MRARRSARPRAARAARRPGRGRAPSAPSGGPARRRARRTRSRSPRRAPSAPGAARARPKRALMQRVLVVGRRPSPRAGSRPRRAARSRQPGSDRAQLVELVGVLRGEHGAIIDAQSRGTSIASRWSSASSSIPAAGEVEQLVEPRAVERHPLGRRLHLDEAPVAGHDDVHVDVGVRVLGVVEVEQRLAVDDADRDGGDRAGQRLREPEAVERAAERRRRRRRSRRSACRRRPGGRRSRGTPCARRAPRSRRRRAAPGRSAAGSRPCGRPACRGRPRARCARRSRPGSSEYSAVIQPRPER